MADSMWALVYDRKSEPWESSTGLRREQVPRPRLDLTKDYRDTTMVLIKPKLAGFCGSDRGIWYRRAFRDMIYGSLDKEKSETRVIGHELLGQVVEVGAEASREFGFKPGDIVSAESHIICGVCYQCRMGDSNVWSTDTRRIRPEVGALQEPFGNAVYACTKVNLRGKSVAIIGCGTIGLFAIAIAKALGARKVIGVEPLENNRRMAKAMGADALVVPGKADQVSYVHDETITREIHDLTDEKVGVDVALEMSGSNAALNTAISAVRRGGHVILFGLKSGDAVIEDFDRVIVDGISLHAVVGRRIFETWHITRNLLESRDPNIHDLIWNVMLNRGEGPIVNFSEFERNQFEKKINNNPKILLRFAN